MTDETRTVDTDEETDDDAVVEEVSSADDANLAAAEDTSAGDDDDFEDDYEDFDDVTCAERVLEVCIRAIVDDEDAVVIEPQENGNRLTLHVSVAQEDMGKIIGKRGRVATALRTLVKAAGGRDGYSAMVEIDD